MFEIAQQCSRAGNSMLEAQWAALKAYTEAMLDGCMMYAERHAEAYRASLATGTVVAKQIMSKPVDPTR